MERGMVTLASARTTVAPDLSFITLESMRYAGRGLSSQLANSSYTNVSTTRHCWQAQELLLHTVWNWPNIRVKCLRGGGDFIPPHRNRREAGGLQFGRNPSQCGDPTPIKFTDSRDGFSKKEKLQMLWNHDCGETLTSCHANDGGLPPVNGTSLNQVNAASGSSWQGTLSWWHQNVPIACR